MAQLNFKFARDNRSKHKRERRERKRLKKLCPMIAHLEKELGEATAEEAALLLIQEFNLEKAEVEFPSGRVIRIQEILDSVRKNTMSAKMVSPIKFWGGPPNRAAQHFQGSLLTMLFDRILYMNSINGEYSDLVGRR
jgi:hypothetical protein